MRGIGIDIVSVSRLNAKVADKILSKKEMVEFTSYMKVNKVRAMEFLAGRLACKEAYLKAYEGVSLVDLSIYKDENGVPKFKGIPNAHVTCSHDLGVAGAVVILE